MSRNALQFVTSFLISSLMIFQAHGKESEYTPLNLTLSRQQLRDILNNPQLPSDPAPGNTSANTFFIKVSHNSVLTENWAKQMCDTVASVLTSVYGANTKSYCFKIDSDNSASKLLFNSKKIEINPDFLFEITRGLDGYLITKLTNLKQTDSAYANAVGWKIEDSANIEENLKERIADSFFAINHLDILRDSLSELVLEANNVNQESVKQQNVGPYTFLKNSVYWTSSTRKFMLVGTQLLATLGVAWYGYHYLSSNNRDYDYSDFKQTIKNKITLGSDFRYDDNSWHTNEAHVYAGVSYYLQCRGAGLTALQSYLCSIAGSTAWEVLVEWREVFSINDQIFTSTGGAILGESLHQLGNYIDQRAPLWFKNSVGWLWKAPQKSQQFLNSAIYSGKNSDLDTNDPLVTGKFEFELGAVQTSSGKSEKRIGITNEVNLIPFYVEPGREIKIYKDLVETEFNLNAPLQDILGQYDIFAKVVLSAYYAKNLNKSLQNNINGYSFFVGPSAALDLKNNASFDNDFMGIVHVLGSTAKLISYYRGFKITSTLDFWGDSVMMKSFMIEDYKNQYGPKELVGNLANADYYHGWGSTTRGQVIVEYGNWNTGIQFNQTTSVNTNARQRDLGQQLKQLDINDQTVTAEIFVERIITKDLKIRFAVERVQRSGEIVGFGSKSAVETRRKFSIIYYF